MADTLRSLAGDAIFKTTDVISALHAPLTPEQIVLDRYVFLPQARSGIAAAQESSCPGAVAAFLPSRRSNERSLEFQARFAVGTVTCPNVKNPRHAHPRARAGRARFAARTTRRDSRRRAASGRVS